MFVPRAATRPTPLSHIACRSIRSATLGMLSPPFYPAYANGGVGFMSVVGNREVVRVCFFFCVVMMLFRQVATSFIPLRFHIFRGRWRDRCLRTGRTPL
jgi:hypothetical protein